VLRFPFTHMEPHAFVAEVYRRMSARLAAERPSPSWDQIKNDAMVLQAMVQCKALLPADKTAAILDVGFGGGWFIAACINLGYTNISGAEFGIEHKQYMKQWSPAVVALHEIENNIGDSLVNLAKQYDFIHLSHVIEHMPKYSLLYIGDSLYSALKPEGTLLLRTPNMEGPCANSSYYVTLAHEYGFSGSNLSSLLSLCNFDDIHVFEFSPQIRSGKQLVGQLLRWPMLCWNAFRHRLFGVNFGGVFGSELIATAKRRHRPPLLNPRYK